MRSLGTNYHLYNVLVVRVANASDLLHVCAVFFNLYSTHIIIIIIIKSAQRTSEAVASLEAEGGRAGDTLQGVTPDLKFIFMWLNL